MDVNIAIPTYKNNGTIIKNLLEALLNQTYSKFRVLIVISLVKMIRLRKLSLSIKGNLIWKLSIKRKDILMRL